jgi:hypothetical protein
VAGYQRNPDGDVAVIAVLLELAERFLERGKR